jgi:hypothetical protein
MRHRLDFLLQNFQEYKSSGLSQANMAANQPESRIPTRTAGWSWGCGPVLNPPEDILSIRTHPLDPGDHKLFLKLLVDIGTDSIPSGKQLSAM